MNRPNFLHSNIVILVKGDLIGQSRSTNQLAGAIAGRLLVGIKPFFILIR